jgi:predicted DNA-binding protein with PD1-like motif
MRYKQFGNKVIVRIDGGEEIIDTLKQICTKLHIALGTIMGVGATDKATIGLYNTTTKQYQSTELQGDLEIAPLYGNISTKDNEIYLHIHVNICNADHESFGGHLTSAVVSATFEGVIDSIDGKIRRVFDEPLGLNLLDI